MKRSSTIGPRQEQIQNFKLTASKLESNLVTLTYVTQNTFSQSANL
jgi:hypothetical protein